MKVLIHPANRSILGLATDFSAKFETLTTGETVEKGIVAERTDREVAAAIAEALRRHEDRWLTKADLVRDSKFFVKSLINVAEGAEVGIRNAGRGMALDIPEDAKPQRLTKADFKVGDEVVMNASISPKYWMNCRGVVAPSPKGLNAKVTVTLHPGDAKRVAAQSGKSVPTSITVPPATLDKDEA